MNLKGVLFFVFLFFSFAQLSFAQSSLVRENASSAYVLPYPSFMPGSFFYKLSIVKDELLKYWYFGDFGQFKYNLKESDKYLVEGKTLFEYKQYLLGASSFKKSDYYFEKLMPALLDAKKNGKNIRDNLKLLKSAGEKHIEVLEKLKGEVPEHFYWDPEKGMPANLNLKEILDNSIRLRKI